MDYLFYGAANHPYFTAFAVLLALLTLASVRIANQYERAVVFFLGRYARTSGPGIHSTTC